MVIAVSQGPNNLVNFCRGGPFFTVAVDRGPFTTGVYLRRGSIYDGGPFTTGVYLRRGLFTTGVYLRRGFIYDGGSFTTGNRTSWVIT